MPTREHIEALAAAMAARPLAYYRSGRMGDPPSVVAMKKRAERVLVAIRTDPAVQDAVLAALVEGGRLVELTRRLSHCPCGGGVHGATQSLPTQRAAFVAAAHQDVPWLLNLVKVLTEDRNDLRDALQEIGEDVVPLTAERDRLYSERNKVLTERLHLTAKRNNLAAESGIAHGFWCESCEFFELDEDLDHNERCIACGCPADDHTSVKVVKELND